MNKFVRVLMALCAIALVASFAVAGPAGSGHVTRLGPGQAFKDADGREVVNSWNSAADVTVTEFKDDGKIVKVTASFPKGASGDVKKFKKGDEVGADGGKVKLKDTDNAKIEIKGGGSIDCEGCDSNDIDFDGAGSLTGGDPTGAKSNNSNDIDYNGHTGTSDTMNGKDNKRHN